MIDSVTRALFAHFCHQEPSRSWIIAGETLPLCARCVGVYAGAALMAFTLPLALFKPSQAVLWLHGLAILQMLFLGFHIVGEQAAWVRTLSGTLFAIGTMYFLWLPVRSSLSPRAMRTWPYLLGVATVIIALQALVRADLRPIASILSALSALGLAAFASLAIAAAVISIRSLALRRLRA
jgi:uncharacterized membrane protein